MPDCTVLYQDVELLAVAKPAGITVVPGRDELLDDSLHGQLQAARGERLWVVHRLDRDTSGALLFARSADAHRALNMAFEARTVHKTYWAIAGGAVLPDAADIRIPLHAARKGRMRPALDGEAGALPSHTGLAVTTRWSLPDGLQASELTLSPHTGRQHQLRVHLRALDAPLAGDPLYRLPEGQRPRWPAEPPRLVLHAARIVFTHPLTGDPLQVDAPLPADLVAFCAALTAHGRKVPP
jgi:tRNA pseudouridine32 synthase / 23S rRNA pseudouridine746 synthase